MRIRFATAEDVFIAFPTLRDDVLAAPSAEEPLAYFARLLRSPTPEDALAFFAYFAPKREAVWWSCRCVRALDPGRGEGAVAAAERWVAEPEDEVRVEALKTAEEAPAEHPATWAAYAAGWSGGNIAVAPQPPILAAPHLTAKAVRAAVLIAVSCAPAIARAQRLELAYDAAMAVARTDLEAVTG